MCLKEEILDLIDENDKIIGQASRSEVSKEGIKNYRVINAFIRNKEGQLWIPRRTDNKRIFPLALDMSVGGHVERGESYLQGFKRELLEELNIRLEDVEYREVLYLNPYKDDISSFMKVYEIYFENTPDYNKSDFIESYWLTPEEVIERITEGDSAKSDLIKVTKLLYSE
ncbi:NUDIX hydrolase [Oceanirhabdus seepicola]|uniref:NUDIX domain-containing protein n=1 Tax=Oceanirhabdus seepicola TaxID=2828781 RepID=A0A9J6P636_9CLOT|nr:NUDIX domain-containing protein [Oceanirhabdus seepicola]MCM1991577.1 NUDIX domain-containing protein [Oceanirhabdus seepicola]